MQLLRLLLPVTVAGLCWFLVCALRHWHDLRQGDVDVDVGAGACEVLTLERDGGRPGRSVARQTARCVCVPGRMAGTTRARPACVRADIVLSRQWCQMRPCLDDEGCRLLVNPSGWTCTQPGGRVKTTTVRTRAQPYQVHVHERLFSLFSGKRSIKLTRCLTGIWNRSIAFFFSLIYFIVSIVYFFSS
ncbi:chemokine-like protein TAFA-1 isoform X2 [Festucalex cinctus]